MEFIHRILSFGITEDTKVSIANRIKAMNAFYLSMTLVLIISIVLVSIIGAPDLRIINLVFLGLYILLYLLIPPYKRLNSSSIIALTLAGLMMLSSYVFLEELSSNVILAFLLMFPIIAITIQAHRGFWISMVMGAIILVMNLIPITESFTPLPLLSLTVFLLIYGAMIIISYFIEKSQTRLVQKQSRIAEYYESEIKQKDEFISQLSHKLRTSLSNITLINNLVHDSRMSTSQKELLDTLKTSTFDLIKDVNELVEIATPAIIDFKQSILSFSLSEAIKGTMAILNSDEDFATEVQLEGVDSLGYNLIGDPSLLRSILINLIKGCDEFKFLGDPVLLSVMVDYESQNLFRLKFSLEFNVEDQKGLKALLNSIQSKSEQRTSKLSNASHLLALTASTIEFSFEGKRSVIYFYQDISKDSTRQIETKDSSKMADTAVPKSGKRSLTQATLLLVEDNAINQKIVLLSLDKQVKQIDVANNGKEALDMFGTKKYDVILMDIQMPVMDGLTATKKIREIESTSDERVPILAITANALAGDRDNCLAAGVDDYVSKPFSVDEVIKKISVLLNK
jgi:CheY-like chemotaxis protein